MRFFSNIFIIALKLSGLLLMTDASLMASSVNSVNGNDASDMCFVDYGKNPDGISALHYAIKMKDEAAVLILLERGTDPNLYCDPIAPPPLFIASEPEFVELLLSYGAFVDVRNSCGQSPLHMAICRATSLEQSAKYCKIAELLIKAGADVNAKDGHGNTALSIAGDREDIRNFLITHGAK